MACEIKCNITVADRIIVSGHWSLGQPGLRAHLVISSLPSNPITCSHSSFRFIFESKTVIDYLIFYEHCVSKNNLSRTILTVKVPSQPRTNDRS